MRRNQCFFVTLLSATLGCGGQSPESQPAGPAAGGQQPDAKPRALVMPSDAATPRWTPDLSLLAELAPDAEATSFDKYRLRAPKGCKFIVGEEKKGSSGEIYCGGTWFDVAEGNAVLDLGIWRLKARSPEPPRMALGKLVYNLSSDMPDLKHGDVEPGFVNSINFARTRWTGTREGRKVQGVLYVSVDGDRIICLRGWITEPQSDQLLKTTEAAILTLKRIE